MCDEHVPKVSSPTSPPLPPIQVHHPNRILPNLMTQEERIKPVKRKRESRSRYMKLYRLRQKRKKAQTIRDIARRRARRREEKQKLKDEEQKLNARRREEEQKKVIFF